MALNMMYITNDPDVAVIAERYGVDRIWVDMEFIGKRLRQGSMDTVQSHHTIEDIRTIRAAVQRSEVLVRINPIHAATQDYGSSVWEIDAAIEAGADVLMLPYFKTVDEVRMFLALVHGRVKTMLLVETPEPVCSAFWHMLRNFRIWNTLPSFPIRSCLNRTGPGESSFTAAATSAIGTAPTVRTGNAIAQSSALFIVSLYIAAPPLKNSHSYTDYSVAYSVFLVN